MVKDAIMNTLNCFDKPKHKDTIEKRYINNAKSEIKQYGLTYVYNRSLINDIKTPEDDVIDCSDYVIIERSIKK